MALLSRRTLACAVCVLVAMSAVPFAQVCSRTTHTLTACLWCLSAWPAEDREYLVRHSSGHRVVAFPVSLTKPVGRIAGVLPARCGTAHLQGWRICQHEGDNPGAVKQRWLCCAGCHLHNERTDLVILGPGRSRLWSQRRLL